MLSAAELVGAVLGTLFMTLGLTAFGTASLRSERRDRSLVWFGIFTFLYRLRLTARSGAVHDVLPLSPLLFGFIESSITYLILIPAGLLATTILGRGAYGIVWRMWQVNLAGAALAIAWDIVKGVPNAAMSINQVLVVANVSVGVLSLARDARPRGWSRDGWLVAGGGALFTVVALVETFRGGMFGSADAEPLAMLVFMGCIGLAVARRVFQNERRVAAVARELDTARRIQQSILPQGSPDVAGVRVTTHYAPMAEVAGDFFDFVVTPAGQLGILVADVSGHGVPAAIVASMVKIALATQGDAVEDPGTVLTRMNRALCGRFELAYVTAVFALLDPRTGTLSYASAGHPPALLLRADRRIQPLDANGLVLGLMPDATYTTGIVSGVTVGDRVLLYTDGLTEAARPDGEFFGDRQLAQFLRAGHTPTADGFTADLAHTARAWAGIDFADDVTIVVAEYA